jgi:hypothetical protein
MGGTATVTAPDPNSRQTRRTRDGDFKRATSGDLDLATHGDFLMATDKDPTGTAATRAFGCVEAVTERERLAGSPARHRSLPTLRIGWQVGFTSARVNVFAAAIGASVLEKGA